MKIEQLYHVTLPNGFILARCGKEQHLNFVDETSVDLREPWEFNFTEKEIKDYDERFWAFAVGGITMSERPFNFEWEEISIRSVTIEAVSNREALRKWKNGDYETPHFDSQDIIGEVVTIDGEDYDLGEGVAE